MAYAKHPCFFVIMLFAVKPWDMTGCVSSCLRWPIRFKAEGQVTQPSVHWYCFCLRPSPMPPLQGLILVTKCPWNIYELYIYEIILNYIYIKYIYISGTSICIYITKNKKECDVLNIMAMLRCWTERMSIHKHTVIFNYV